MGKIRQILDGMWRGRKGNSRYSGATISTRLFSGQMMSLYIFHIYRWSGEKKGSIFFFFSLCHCFAKTTLYIHFKNFELKWWQWPQTANFGARCAIPEFTSWCLKNRKVTRTLLEICYFHCFPSYPVFPLVDHNYCPAPYCAAAFITRWPFLGLFFIIASI